MYHIAIDYFNNNYPPRFTDSIIHVHLMIYGYAKEVDAIHGPVQ